MIKGFGSFSGGLCIHEALVLQHAAVPYIILSDVCTVHLYIHTGF